MAIKSQTALLKVSTAAAASDTITAITAANPPVVTSASHGMANGTIVLISGVVGMTEVNDRVFVVASQSTNTFELKGVDGSAYTAYTSGGLAYAQSTMTTVGQVASISGFDGQADEIDVTHLSSTAKEYLVGLQDFGNLTADLNLDVSDTGQAKMRALKTLGTVGYFSVTLSDTKVAAFPAFVRSFTFQNNANDAARAQTVLRIAKEPAYFA